MKPRTKLQFRVVSLSSQLPDIESMMAEWANNDCLDHIGYATKSRIICMECGERFSAELVKRKRAGLSSLRCILKNRMVEETY